MVWDPIDVALELRKHLLNRDRIEVAVAICRAESHFNDQAKLDNTTLNPPGEGIDRGLFQINSFWHPEVTDEMAFDGLTNIREAVRIYRDNGSTWNPWVTFTTGAYEKYLEMAAVAVEAALRIRTKDAVIAGLNTIVVQDSTAITARDAQIVELNKQVEDAGETVADLTAQVEELAALRGRFDAWVVGIREGA